MSGLRTYLYLSILAVSSCGLGPLDAGSGGDENLPQSGAGPYLFAPADFDTPADEPYILAQPIVSLTDPSVRTLEDGRFEVFYTRTSAEGSEIWRVQLESLVESPGEPTRVLAATETWEGATVRAPSIVEGDEELFLYYEGGDDAPGIGVASSIDGGLTFSKAPENPLVENARDPDVATSGARWLLVHTDLAGSEILLREGTATVYGDARPLISARLGKRDAFDALGVRAPALRWRESAVGREHFGLFYEGLGANADGDGVSGIGYQASFDLENWFTFLDGEPILAAGPAGAGGPAPLLFGTESLLFVHQRRQGRGRLAVAFGP